MCELSPEIRSANKLKYMTLLSMLNVDLTAFMQYLDSTRMDFFNKPYNVYESGAYAGALCEHSLAIYDEVIRLCEIYAPGQYSQEDIIKATLLRDLYRGELFEEYTKNQKNEATGQWEQVTAYRMKEVRPVFGDIGFSSFMIARKFFDLSNDDVVEALTQTAMTNNVDSYFIRASYKLVPIILMAEVAVSYLRA